MELSKWPPQPSIRDIRDTTSFSDEFTTENPLSTESDSVKAETSPKGPMESSPSILEDTVESSQLAPVDTGEYLSEKIAYFQDLLCCGAGKYWMIPCVWICFGLVLCVKYSATLYYLDRLTNAVEEESSPETSTIVMIAKPQQNIAKSLLLVLATATLQGIYLFSFGYNRLCNNQFVDRSIMQNLKSREQQQEMKRFFNRVQSFNLFYILMLNILFTAFTIKAANAKESNETDEFLYYAFENYLDLDRNQVKLILFGEENTILQFFAFFPIFCVSNSQSFTFFWFSWLMNQKAEEANSMIRAESIVNGNSIRSFLDLMKQMLDISREWKYCNIVRLVATLVIGISDLKVAANLPDPLYTDLRRCTYVVAYSNLFQLWLSFLAAGYVNDSFLNRSLILTNRTEYVYNDSLDEKENHDADMMLRNCRRDTMHRMTIAGAEEGMKLFGIKISTANVGSIGTAILALANIQV